MVGGVFTGIWAASTSGVNGDGLVTTLLCGLQSALRASLTLSLPLRRLQLEFIAREPTFLLSRWGPSPSYATPSGAGVLGVGTTHHLDPRGPGEFFQVFSQGPSVGGMGNHTLLGGGVALYNQDGGAAYPLSPGRQADHPFRSDEGEDTEGGTLCLTSQAPTEGSPSKTTVSTPCPMQPRSSNRLATAVILTILSKAMARKAGLCDGRPSSVSKTQTKSRLCGVTLCEGEAKEFVAFLNEYA